MPMAGTGSRFAEAGYQLPKPLIPVNGIPMFVHSERCIGIDFTRRIFITRTEHNLKPTILQYYPDAVVIEIDYVTQGTACTLLLAREYYEDGSSIFVANCDQHVELNTWALNETISQHELDGLIAVFPESGQNPKWSYAQIDEDKQVYRVAEKNPISEWATVGFYYWRDGRHFIQGAEAMIAADDRVNGEFYTCPVYNYTIPGRYTRAFVVDRMQGIGTPEDLQTWLNS